MRWIYISPHLDDAILSCGGLIWEQSQAGHKVEVWTIFSGFPPPGERSPLAVQVEGEWTLEGQAEGMVQRREEDRRACQIAGATCVQFDFLDVIYRRSPQGEPLYTELFVPPVAAEAGVLARITATLAEGLEGDEQLVCPLTLGGHTDHILARQAVEALKNPVWYYADVPYLLRYPEELAPAVTGLQRQSFPVSKKGLDVWQEACAAYRTQVPVLFGGQESMRVSIKEYWAQDQSTLLWRSA
jgi:LmbE family N-acetylglucosaminyl deacetylase